MLPQTDGGVDGGNPPGPISWASMTLAPTSGVFGVALLSRSLAYAVGVNGQIQRYDGNGWSEVTRSPSNSTLHALYVSADGALFAGGGTQLVSCLADCHLAASYQWRTVASANVRGVCGKDADTVYATGIAGPSSNAGVLYQFQPATSNWTLLDADTDSFTNDGCWVSPTGTLFIAAQSEIIRREGGLSFQEQINFPAGWTINDIAFQYFEAVGGSGDRVWAVGHRRGVIERNAQGTWDYVQPADGIDDYHAVAASGSEALVGGSRSGDGRFLRLFNGQAWVALPNPPDLNIHGVSAAPDGRTWLVGGTASGTVGAVWIGLRP